MPRLAFGGVFSVLPTPFDASGEFDPASLGRVIDPFPGDGFNGFTPGGALDETTIHAWDRVLSWTIQAERQRLRPHRGPQRGSRAGVARLAAD
jgi:hypothetical protein